MRTISLIVLHCSGTRCDRSFSFEQCRDNHTNERKWRDIGYHWYITRDGIIHQGRPEAICGAHVHLHNTHSIGVCYEGGLDSRGVPFDTRTETQKASLLKLLTELHQRYPRAIILGHRDLSPDLNHDGRITPNEFSKQCPCFDAMIDYQHLQPDGFWQGIGIY